ncbi:MAG: lipocalin, partial [Rikenellaceae bacterium]|nr:lipocalin [Rikenellaceae bacterium]
IFYNILALDEDYQWSLVGSSSPDYLWILSRTPQLPQQTLNNILDIARKRGYDTSKLIFVKQ